jgi:hypothetical protein
MPWKNADIYKFTQDHVLWVAPKKSGVYGIYSSGRCLFVGETSCIQETLEGHLNGDTACIAQHDPTEFLFEIVSEKYRKGRKDELIAELRPLCP